MDQKVFLTLWKPPIYPMLALSAPTPIRCRIPDGLQNMNRIAQLLAQRRAGHMLPADLYTSRDAFEADTEVIFSRHWIAVGVEGDVEEPGDVVALDIGPGSIVIVRDDEGELRAFHNVCSHRGSRLLDAGRHVVGKLVCPYHQWTYELDGSLAFARHMGSDFDRRLAHLKPVHLRSIGGLLYACLGNEPPADIDELAAVMEPRLAPYDLAHARIAHEQEIIEPGNWKLTMENNRECYHCSANHPDLSLSFHAADFGFDPEGLTPAEREEVDGLAKAYARESERWAAQGLPYEVVERTRGSPTNFRTQRLIIAGHGESHTRNTRAAVRIPLGRMNMPGAGDVHLWGINSWNHFMSDHAVVTTIYPLGPDRTLLRTKWLVNRDAVEGKDYDLDNLKAVWEQTNLEDSALVARAHAGVASKGYQPGPYSRFTERALDDFAGWYVERMKAHEANP